VRMRTRMREGRNRPSEHNGEKDTTDYLARFWFGHRKTSKKKKKTENISFNINDYQTSQ
jgi:hypothetical protein